MGLKQIIKKQKEKRRIKRESMSPFRWKILTVGLPIYVVALLFPALIVLVLLGAGNDAGLIVAYAWPFWLLAVNVAMFVFLARATGKDVEIEMGRFAYLFQNPKPWQQEPLTVLDDVFAYTLDKEGARLELPPIEGEQVFDEAQENVFYIPWDKAELCLATQSVYRRVYIALAVFPLDSNSNAIPFFVPMNEEVFAFLKATGLDERMDADWLYLLYNPKDAFKQIVKYGRILKMRHKDTGKTFVDEGEFIEE